MVMIRIIIDIVRIHSALTSETDEVNVSDEKVGRLLFWSSTLIVKVTELLRKLINKQG